MRRYLLFIVLVILFSACQGQILLPGVQVTPQLLEMPALLAPVATPATVLTISPTPVVETIVPRTLPATAETAISASEAGFLLRYHPDGPLFVGDWVSVEVIPAQGVTVDGSRVEVRMEDAQGVQKAEAKFTGYGLGGKMQATLTWFWNTADLPGGEHTLTYSVLPDGPTWTDTVHLLPADQVPPPEPQAIWASAETDCCLVYYVTGTEAERDLHSLLEVIDLQARSVTTQMSAELTEAIPIVFLPRVLGHGGFAAEEIAVSYLDRNYAGGLAEVVIHHEMIHILDARLGGQYRPSMLVEGLAVYLSGGHFKPEPLMERAAALLPPEPGCLPLEELQSLPQQRPEVCGLDWYIPLEDLAQKFYLTQHEIGYLQAGALIEFMVDTWGWEAFSGFYRHISQLSSSTEQPGAPKTTIEALDQALITNFGINLSQLEEQFIRALSDQPVSPWDLMDVRLTVEFYNTVRRYQQALDPSAYFLNAWLPDSVAMRKRGIVADYLRRPGQPENLALESMLVRANISLLKGEFDTASNLLQAVNAALDSRSALPLLITKGVLAVPWAANTPD